MTKRTPFCTYTLLSLSENSGRLTWVRLQQLQDQRYPVLQVHAGSFRISVILRILTWTTGSLRITCVRDDSFFLSVRIQSNTQGVGHTPTSQHNIHFRLGKTLTTFSCAPGGVRTSRVFGPRVRRSTHWATPRHVVTLVWERVTRWACDPLE